MHFVGKRLNIPNAPLKSCQFATRDISDTSHKFWGRALGVGMTAQAIDGLTMEDNLHNFGQHLLASWYFSTFITCWSYGRMYLLGVDDSVVLSSDFGGSSSGLLLFEHYKAYWHL